MTVRPVWFALVSVIFGIVGVFLLAHWSSIDGAERFAAAGASAEGLTVTALVLWYRMRRSR
jgi:hypothetical protein